MMCNKNIDSSLTKIEVSQLQEMVTSSINDLLENGEFVIRTSDFYDLVTIFDVNDEYLLCSIYQLSKCKQVEGRLEEVHETPIVAVAQHHIDMDGFESALDEQALESLGSNAKEAIMLTTGVFRSLILQKIDELNNTCLENQE
jgi:hypothetical protein